jgi:HlyD family secretion protein
LFPRSTPDVATRLAFVGLLAAAGTFWWWHTRPPAATAWQGYADADFVKIGPTQEGLLTSVAVHRSDLVSAGSLFFWR